MTLNFRTVAILMFALLVAGLTAVMARNWLAAQRAAMVQPTQQQEEKVAGTFVLVAKTAMKPGQFAQPQNLEWVAWPEAGVPQAYVVKSQRKMEDFVGSVARQPIAAGDPITGARFVKPGERGFMAAVLTPGNRAITVPITATSGNAGFVFHGDLVDVILTAKFTEEKKEGSAPGDNKPQNFAATVLSGVRVLAIDQKTEADKAEVGKTATIEVSPKQAEIVALALQMGQLALSLRSLTPPEEPGSIVSADPDDTAPTSPRYEKPRSYTMDRELHFMLDDRSNDRPASVKQQEVTVLRGSGAAKQNSGAKSAAK